MPRGAFGAVHLAFVAFLTPGIATAGAVNGKGSQLWLQACMLPALVACHHRRCMQGELARPGLGGQLSGCRASQAQQVVACMLIGVNRAHQRVCPASGRVGLRSVLRRALGTPTLLSYVHSCDRDLFAHRAPSAPTGAPVPKGGRLSLCPPWCCGVGVKRF